jgi:mono/diheme cytochrome c family protein
LNTAKQVNIMIGLLMVGLVGTFLYYMFDSGYTLFGVNFGDRQAHAVERQEVTNVERGAHLFARYCRSCHGLVGEGAAERAGLPGADLNKDENRPPGLALSQLPTMQKRFKDTIECGRVGTQMPPWLVENGGPLNFFQVEQLVKLISSEFSPEGWEEVVTVGNGDPEHGGDQLDPRTFLTESVGTDDTTLHLSSVEAIDKGQILRIGLQTIEDPYELFLVKAVNENNNTIDVERGPNVEIGDPPQVFGTDPIEHESGDEVYNLTVGLPPGTITGDPESQGFAPCGQSKAQPATPPQPVDITNGTAITVGDNFFQVDSQNNPEMHVAAGASISANISNTGTAIHNLRIAGPDGQYNTDDDEVSSPDAVPGGTNATIAINVPAGTYKYQCDFHTDAMKGEVVAQ